MNRRFFLTLLAVVLIFHAFIGWRLVPALTPLLGWALIVWLVLSFFLMPLGMLAQRGRAGAGSDALAWAGMLAMGLFSSLFVLTVLRDVVTVGRFALAEAAIVPGVTNQWLADTANAVLVLALAVTAVGLYNARRRAPVVEIEVPIAGLPSALDGFRIVQISDIHVGATIKRAYLAAIVAAVNATQADVIAITGDLIDGSVAALATHVAPLAKLTSRYGSFFVTGNHEYYSGANAWIAEVRRLGITVLMNEHQVIEHEDARLVLAGVTDFNAHQFDPEHQTDALAAIKGAPADAGVRVLLAHQPRSAAAALQAGFDLQLSGHTHGGQFLPWNFVVPLQQPFTAGLHRMDKLWVYVSRGTGYWGPPKRFGAPSEITLVRLTRA